MSGGPWEGFGSFLDSARGKPKKGPKVKHSVAETRTYTVGVPLTVTVHPGGFVQVQAYLEDVTCDMPDESTYSDDQLAEDLPTVTAWIEKHTLTNEGFIE